MRNYKYFETDEILNIMQDNLIKIAQTPITKSDNEKVKFNQEDEAKFPGIYEFRKEALKMLDWIITKSQVNIGKTSAKKIESFIKQLADPQTDRKNLKAPTSYDINQVAANIILYNSGGQSLSDQLLTNNIQNLLKAMEGYTDSNYFSYVDPTTTINTWKKIINKIKNNEPTEIDSKTKTAIQQAINTQSDLRLAQR